MTFSRNMVTVAKRLHNDVKETIFQQVNPNDSRERQPSYFQMQEWADGVTTFWSLNKGEVHELRLYNDWSETNW